MICIIKRNYGIGTTIYTLVTVCFGQVIENTLHKSEKK